jgi:LPXTG-site transpeptidase (sortase) family protein
MLTGSPARGRGRHRCRRAPARGSNRVVNAAAAVLVVSGLVTAGATGWDWTERVHEIGANQTTLAGRWERDPTGLVGRLRAPRQGLDLVVVEGVGDADLLRGPGHMPATARFGEPGNVGIAGHRYPGAFWNLDELHVGDPVVMETRDRWYVYRINRAMVVGPADTGVLAAHPAGAPATVDQFLTLVTCDPIFTTLRRLIRQAVLVRAVSRTEGVPTELSS